MAKFEKIKGVYSFNDISEDTKPGQWFIDNNSIRAQYLGRTKHTIVMNYKKYQGKIDFPHMLANHHLRMFAIKYSK